MLLIRKGLIFDQLATILWKMLFRNAFSNLASRIWTQISVIICVPFHIHFLGINGFGLIGLFTSFIAIFSVFDFGFGLAFNREAARSKDQSSLATLLKSLEYIYWAISFGIMLLVILGTPIAFKTILSSLDPTVPSNKATYFLMGFSVSTFGLVNLYTQGLMGLERQLTSAVLNIITATIRNFGAVAVTAYFKTPLSFFAWQASTIIFQTLLFRSYLWKAIGYHSAKPNWKQIGKVKSFIMGNALISIFGVILTQADKLIVSSICSLKVFGYYSLASTVANGLIGISHSVNVALFPRLSSCIADKNMLSLRAQYSNGSRLMLFVLAPIAAIVCIFPEKFLLLWGQPQSVATYTAPFVRWLCVGALIHSLLLLPYNLQLSSGWTALYVIQSGLLSLVYPLLTYYLASTYGPLHILYTWASVNAALLFLIPAITHRRVLRGYFSKWILKDILLPLALACCTPLILISIVPQNTFYPALLIPIGLCSLILTGLTLKQFKNSGLLILNFLYGKFSSKSEKSGHSSNIKVK